MSPYIVSSTTLDEGGAEDSGNSGIKAGESLRCFANFILMLSFSFYSRGFRFLLGNPCLFGLPLSAEVVGVESRVPTMGVMGKVKFRDTVLFLTALCSDTLGIWKFWVFTKSGIVGMAWIPIMEVYVANSPSVDV